MIRCLGFDSAAIYKLEESEIASFQRQNSARLWLDLQNPTEEELRWLETTFAVNQQNLTDTQTPTSPDYVAAYPGYLFGSAYHPIFQDSQLYGLRTHFCLFQKGILTIHGNENNHIETLWLQYESDMGRWGFGLDHLLAELLQAWNDDFSTALAGLQQEIRGLSGGPAGSAQSNLLELRREFSYLGQLTERQTALLKGLQQQSHPAFDELVKHRLTRHLAQLTTVHSEMERGAWWAESLYDQQQQARQNSLLGWILIAVVGGIVSFWLAQLLQLLL